MTKAIKKPVHSSHLALRYYARDGWDEELLLNYLVKGRLTCKDVDRPELAYWSLDVGGVMDVEKLYNEQVSEVRRYYDGPPKESDVEYMKTMNW